MKILSIFLFVWTVFFNHSIAQDFLNNSVAKVGSFTITDKEFLERYEMTPGMNRHRQSTIESQKIEFLFSLVAEKLWAIDAISRGLDTTEVIRFAEKSFEKMFVRDVLFNREITEKIKITDAELAEGLRRNSSKLYVRFLFSEDADEINFLHKLLNDGIPFDSILAESPEKLEQINPLEIVFGQMDESVEELLFNLDLGQYTQPILTPDGWYIFYLVNKSSEFLENSNQRDDVEKNVKKTLEARKLIEQQKIFYSNFFKNKKVDVNPELFELLAKNISSLFEYKKKNFLIKDGELINLEPADIIKMEEVFGENTIRKPFILLDENPVSFKDYLRSLIFDGYNSTDYKLNFIRASLDNRVRRDIEKELLYREGLNRGYNELAEVKSEVSTWKLNYLFNLLKDKFKDSVSVSDEDIYNYYLEKNKPETYPMLVNVIEILTDSIKTVEKIFDELKDGVDFKELALIYNKRESTKKNNGEYGLFPIYRHGEIGKIASTLNIGDVYGPLQLAEGYSVFKLIDKQDEMIIPPKPFEKFKEQYRNDLSFQKLYGKITEFTYSLAVKYGVSLNLDLLEQIKVTSLPSFGIRYLGFGGKMTAVPLIAPNVDWAEKWIKNQQPQMVP